MGYLWFYIFQSLAITIGVFLLIPDFLKDKSTRMSVAWLFLFLAAFLHVLEGVAMGHELMK